MWVDIRGAPVILPKDVPWAEGSRPPLFVHA